MRLSGGVVLEQIEDDRVGDEPGLHHLGQPGGELVSGQRLERRQIAQHGRRLMERADQILARLGVDRRLAADRGVDHRQQRGRHVHHPHAAQPRRGDEAGEVGDGAPAEPDRPGRRG